MKRIFSVLLITLLIGLSVVNPGYGEDSRSVTDALNREVSLSESPERVVTTIASTTEIALDLGLDERLVGVPKLIEHLSYVPELQEKAEKKEKIGGFNLSHEKIVALDPDLVVVGASAQGDVVTKLEDLGLTVYAAGSESIDQVKEAIFEIGYLTRTVEQAKKIVGSMDYKEFRLREATKKLNKRKAVFYTFSAQMYTVGGGTFLGQVIEKAGLNNVFSELSGYKQVSTEEIIEKNPEFVIATEDMELSVKELKNDVGLKNVKALEEGNVMLLSSGEDSLINQPGTKVVDGAINLFEKVYDKEVQL